MKSFFGTNSSRHQDCKTARELGIQNIFFLCGTIWKMFGVKDTSCLQAFALVMFLVVLACHYPVLYGFDQHFLLAAPLINLSNNDNFFLYKKIWNAGNQTRGSWVRKLVH